MGEDQIPPHNIEAERAVLGGMILDPDGCDLALDIIRATDFYMERHQIIFEAIGRLSDRSRPVEELVLREELGDRADAVGGLVYLHDLTADVTSAALIEQHCALIRDCATLRTLIRYASGVLSSVYTPGARAQDIVSQADADLTKICIGSEREQLQPYPEILELLISAEPGDGAEGLRTHYVDLDDLGVSLAPGNLTTIAGLSSTGKTSFMANLVFRLSAYHEHRPVLISSLEMSRREIAELLVQIGARVDTSKRHATSAHLWPSPEDHERFVNEAVRQMEVANIHIDDRSSGLRQIRAQARRLKRRGGLDLLVVDYLQEMDDPPRTDNRHQSVGGNARGLKALARELEIPVIVLSQIAQEAERASDSTPVKAWLKFLKESGDIRNTSDQVILLYRPGFYDETSSADAVPIEVVVAKNRTGPTGKVKLVWIGAQRRIEDRAPDFMGSDEEETDGR